MVKVLLVTIILSLVLRSCLTKSNRTFPSDFSFGAATAAFQIEGAWDADGKGENIWDRYVHTNASRIVDGSNADVACDSYHKFVEDVSLAADMGLTHYRFSISWTRILPGGFTNNINLKGLLYYQNLIREVENRNMTPVVTIYHWDLPQALEDLGGWTNPRIINVFKAYAEVLFKNFNTIKYWITINEPKQVCQGGYGKGSMAPGLTDSGQADYLCTSHVIKAHAAVYNLYKERFKKSLGGKVTIGLDGAWSMPYWETDEDKDAADRKLYFEFGLYTHPIFFGDWPDVVKDRVAYRSKLENFGTSRLPTFTDEEKNSIKNTADFIAFNFYNTKLVKDADEAPSDSVSFNNDVRIIEAVDPRWTIAPDGNTIYPDGLRSYLSWIKNTYNDPEIFITENGVADSSDTGLEDNDRIKYLADYLNAVLDAIYEDKVKVIGYTMWSLMDNFEWRSGYSMRYGFYSVDFNDPDRPRTAKKSVEYFSQLIKDRTIPDLPATTPKTVSYITQ